MEDSHDLNNMSDNKELELQFSPSHWNRRYEKPEDVVTEHIRIVTEVSEEVKSKIPCTLEVPYGDSEGQKLDLFGFDVLPNDAPIFVYIHGGYWQMLSRSVSSYCVEPLFKKGIAVVIVGYDLAPKVSLDEIIAQILRAAEYILQLAVERKSKGVFFGGYSAGGHLVASLASSEYFVNSPKLCRMIKGFICFSGLFDLRQVIYTTYNEALHLSPEDAERNTILLHVNTVSTPLAHAQVLVMVGEYDSPEFQRQSCKYAEILVSKGVKTTHMIIPKVDHFNLVEKLKDLDSIETKAVIKMILQITSAAGSSSEEGEHEGVQREEPKEELPTKN